MIKLIIAIILAFFSTFSFGQNKGIENFINQVYPRFVSSSHEYYNLVDSSFLITLEKYSLEKDELDTLLKRYPDFSIDFFIQKVSESKRVNWRDYHLDKAKISMFKSVPKFRSHVRIDRMVPFRTPKRVLDSLEKIKEYNEVIVPVKSSWSDNRIGKKIEKAWAKYSNSIRKEDKDYFRFSTPVFSNDGLYIMITINRSDNGATYIFKKTGNTWTEIFVFNRWIS